MATISNSQVNGGSPDGLEGDNSATKGMLDQNITQEDETRAPQQNQKKSRVPFASLFKNNRKMNESQKLPYFPKGTNRLDFTYDDIDTVEETYGICLLGYVISGRPPTSALLDLVRRWGKDVHFQTHESGWIVFTFPSIVAKEKVLGGGSYLVYGFYLYLKEMPRCFRFREEDMNSLPSWVQIHGLPPDCWNHTILGNICSEIGMPLHMDFLTHGRKRVMYARVLIEINAANTRVNEIDIGLPIGRVKVQIVYEENINFCHDCNTVGHDVLDCPKFNKSMGEDGTKHTNHLPRQRSRSVAWRRGRSRGRSRVFGKHRRAPSRPPNSGQNPLPSNDNHASKEETKLDKDKESDVHGVGSNVEIETQKNIDKGKGVIENELPQLNIPTTSGVVDEEGYTKVSNKKKKKNKKKKNKQNGGGSAKKDEEMAVFFDGMRESDPCDTEYRPKGSYDTDGRFFGNERKGRQPKDFCSSNMLGL